MILAWLNDAIRDRERAARLTESEGGQNWREDPFVYGVRDQTNVMVARSREERAASITHIALNDPESVLRRCAADRKILELHRAVPDQALQRGRVSGSLRWRAHRPARMRLLPYLRRRLRDSPLPDLAGGRRGLRLDGG